MIGNDIQKVSEMQDTFGDSAMFKAMIAEGHQKDIINELRNESEVLSKLAACSPKAKEAQEHFDEIAATLNVVPEIEITPSGKYKFKNRGYFPLDQEMALIAGHFTEGIAREKEAIAEVSQIVSEHENQYKTIFSNIDNSIHVAARQRRDTRGNMELKKFDDTIEECLNALHNYELSEERNKAKVIMNVVDIGTMYDEQAIKQVEFQLLYIRAQIEEALDSSEEGIAVVALIEEAEQKSTYLADEADQWMTLFDADIDMKSDQIVGKLVNNFDEQAENFKNKRIRIRNRLVDGEAEVLKTRKWTTAKSHWRAAKKGLLQYNSFMAFGNKKFLRMLDIFGGAKREDESMRMSMIQLINELTSLADALNIAKSENRENIDMLMVSTNQLRTILQDDVLNNPDLGRFKSVLREELQITM